MDFRPTDEQAMLRDMLQRFAADRHGPEQRRAWRALPGGFSADNRAMLAELGIFALPLPAEQGGIGGSLADQAVVMEALGHALASDPVLVPQMLAAALLLAASPAGDWSGVVEGRDLVTLALADADGPAIVDRDGLSGAKSFVPHAEAAQILMVTCLRDGAPALCILPGDAPGLIREDRRLVDGSHASAIRFESVAVPPDACVPCPPDLLATALRRAAVAGAAEMLGILQRLFDSTRDYVRTRQQFGVAIGSFQAVRHRMARLFILVEQARSLVLKAALTPIGDVRWPAAVAACQTYLEEAALDLAHGCVQLHGGMGITDEIDISEGHRRLLVLRRLFAEDGAYPLPPARDPIEKAA